MKRALRAAFFSQPVEVAGLLLAIQFFYAPVASRLQTHLLVSWLLGAVTVAGVGLIVVLQARRRRRLTIPLRDAEAFTGSRSARRGLMITVAGERSYSATVLAGLLPLLTALDLVGLLATDRLTAAEQDTYERATRASGVREVRVERADPDQVQDPQVRAGLLLDWMVRSGLDASDIVVEITEGKKPLSVGAYLAAVERGIECQYTTSNYAGDLRVKGTERTGPVT